MTSLVISEVFGPTIQGEGPNAGRRASFVRLQGCNLHCAWCDTPYTWDASRYDMRAESERQDVVDIAARALKDDPGIVVISGGEPLLHQRQPAWRDLLEWLDVAAARVEIETNGTIAPTVDTAQRATFNVSPKLSHSGDDLVDRIRPDVLKAFGRLARAGRACFKFVVRDAVDVRVAAALAADCGVPRDAVWVMPLGTTPAQLVAGFGDIADAAIAAGVNVTTRLHVLAWGDERGR